jgi:hypothetical protein
MPQNPCPVERSTWPRQWVSMSSQWANEPRMAA